MAGEKGIYGIFDNVSELLVGPILLFAGDPAAIRAFRDIAENPETEIYKHQGDYDLINLGELIDLAGTPHITAKKANTILKGKTLQAIKTNTEIKNENTNSKIEQTERQTTEKNTEKNTEQTKTENIDKTQITLL